MLAIMLRIRQPEKKLNILIGNLNDAKAEAQWGRKVCECLLTLRYYVLLFSLRLYYVVKMHNNNKSRRRRRRRSRGAGKKNNANKQKVAKVHNGKIETEIMKIA